MNKKNLQQIFTNYISKFESISSPSIDESYKKWELVQLFQDTFDLEAEDFPSMLDSIWDESSNLIDNKKQQPFYGIICCARKEPETIRAMFRALYVADDGDLTVRQSKISAFLASADTLRQKYFPDNWRYANDQRSVMTYLFLHDPDHNYMYKYTQATEFAACVEFLDDWGSGASFKLDVYYRMCDELVEAIKANPLLMATNASRFESPVNPMYSDDELHILAFDIIYCSSTHGLFDGISYERPTPDMKRLSKERKEKSKQLYMDVEAAEAKVLQLTEAKKYFIPLFCIGRIVRHRAFGHGTVTENDDSYVKIHFDSKNETKRFLLLSSIANGFLSVDVEDFSANVTRYKPVMLKELELLRALERANSAFAPYADCIEE